MPTLRRGASQTRIAATGGSQILLENESPYASRRVVVECDGVTTAAYLHDYFEPTARAIDGLEKALAGLGLLDDALALDLRKPQDYFHRVWNTAFLATDLANAGSEDGQYDDEDETEYAGTAPALQ